MQEKDSISEDPQSKSPKLSLKDTILRSIRAQYKDLDPYWENINEAQGDDRSQAWAVMRAASTHNVNVDRYVNRIRYDIYQPVNSRKGNIVRMSKDAISKLRELSVEFDKLCHHIDCEESENCPSSHEGDYNEDRDLDEEDCAGLLNMLSPFYWIASREFREIASDMSAGVINNNHSPLGMIFALSRSIYRYKTIFTLAGMQSYHEQHPEGYDERGLLKFYDLRDNQMWYVNRVMSNLSTELTNAIMELQDYAEAWKPEESKE